VKVVLLIHTQCDLKYSKRKEATTKARKDHSLKKGREGLGCSSVVEHLPSMRKALHSIPIPKTKGKKKKKPWFGLRHIISLMAYK
jgi:hypothetical protein